MCVRARVTISRENIYSMMVFFLRLVSPRSILVFCVYLLLSSFFYPTVRLTANASALLRGRTETARSFFGSCPRMPGPDGPDPKRGTLSRVIMAATGRSLSSLATLSLNVCVCAIIGIKRILFRFDHEINLQDADLCRFVLSLYYTWTPAAR